MAPPDLEDGSKSVSSLPSLSNVGKPPSGQTGYTRADLQLLNLLQHPVWIFDAQRTRMFWANTAALSLWNAPNLQELLQRDYATDMTHATRQRIQGLLQQLQAGKVVQEQWTYYPRGKPQTVNVTASLVWIVDDDDNDGKDQKPTPRPAILDEGEIPSEQFQKAATRDIELLRHVPIAVSQFDTKGELLYQNPQDIDTFGCYCATDNNECNDNDDNNTFVDRFVDRQLGQGVLKRVVTGQEVNVQAEQYVVPSTSREETTATRFFAVSVRRSKDPSASTKKGSPTTNSEQFVILYTARDVTEIIQARKDQDKVKLKAEFLSVIAHELRTPLHQVVGYADMLALTELNNRQLESVKLIQQSAESLMVIINDLLEYNRIESGKLSIEHIHFCLGNVLEGCVAAVETEAAVRNLYLRTQFATDLPALMILGDPNRTRQIMLNLLQNAVKFTEKGGITFTASTIQDQNKSASDNQNENTNTRNNGKDNHTVLIRFQVIDTGIGIAPEHQTAIFTKFQQANSSISRKFGGTGLGLSICRSLSEAMGGCIDLESTLGKGTAFSVVLPFEIPTTGELDKDTLSASSCHANAGTTTETRLNDALPPLTKTLRVLVVEDNKVNQKMVRRMLEKLGHSVQVAENGRVAVDFLQSYSNHNCGSVAVFGEETQPHAPDLVLMDVHMPVMDGIEATRQVRHQLQLSKTDLPVVGLTASFQTSDLQTYLDAGMNTCLSKPIRLESLKRTLQSFCQASA